MARSYFLLYARDYIEDADRYTSKRAAIDAFRQASDELDRYGQTIEASLHIADCRDDIAEYPDYVLSRGPRGGVKVESA